jgi:alcohol dehydrogenase
MMTPSFQFATVPRLICGLGAVRDLPALVTEAGSRRPFIVTDPGISRAGLLAPVVEPLRGAGLDVGVFAGVVADPPESVVQAAVAAAQAARADLIIGLGGGSAMDTAKLVALLVAHPQPLSAIYGVGAVVGPRQRPLILVPTTAGTGSEVTCISIVTTGETTKMGVVSPQLYADVAVLDAGLTLGLPQVVTAHTGIDAMVHAIEAYTSRHRKNPLSDLLAREALRLLTHNLPRVLADGDDAEARQAMLLGACLAGQAFANAPVAAVHALAYPLGGVFHLTHGLSNALMLTAVLRFNLPVAGPLYEELAPIVGETTAEGFIARLDALCREAGIERRLREVDIPEDALPMLAAEAMKQTRLLVNNPREVSEADARALYEAVW